MKKYQNKLFLRTGSLVFDDDERVDMLLQQDADQAQRETLGDLPEEMPEVRKKSEVYDAVATKTVSIATVQDASTRLGREASTRERRANVDARRVAAEAKRQEREGQTTKVKRLHRHW